MKRIRFAVAAAVLLLTTSAHAQEAVDPDKVFDEAMSLVAEERYADAIPKLEQAQRLDPGIGTQFNLAACYAKVGRLALAWKNFRQVQALAKAAGKQARADAARTELDELRPRLADVSVNIERAGPVTVSVDDEITPAPELGFIALDPCRDGHLGYFREVDRGESMQAGLRHGNRGSRLEGRRRGAAWPDASPHQRRRLGRCGRRTRRGSLPPHHIGSSRRQEGGRDHGSACHRPAVGGGRRLDHDVLTRV